MFFLSGYLPRLFVLFCAAFAVIHWRAKRAKTLLARLDRAELHPRFRKVRNMAIVYGVVAVSTIAILRQIFKGYIEAQRQIFENPYIDHLAWQSSLASPEQSRAQIIILLIFIAAAAFSYLAVENIVVSCALYSKLRAQPSQLGLLAPSISAEQNGHHEKRPVLPIAAIIGGIVVIAAILSGTTLFRSRRSGATLAPMPSTGNVPITSVHVAATDGFWLTEVGGSAENYREVSVDIDDAGTAYLDLTDNGLATMPLSAKVWSSQEPNHFLVIEKINVDQWQGGVRSFPGQRTVRVVKALCL